MKQLLILAFLFGMTLFFLPSCQKELSTESNTNNASFSLTKDSSNECLDTITVAGNYYNGVSAALSGNFVTLVVNVKSTGNYVISTDINDTNNGFSFYDSGFFSKLGLDTLVLLPRGKPILVGATDFSFSGSTCSFTIDVQDSTGTGLGGVDTSGSGDSSYIDPNPAATNSWHFTDTATGVTYKGVFTSLEGAGFRNDTLFIAGQATSTADTGFGVTLKIPSLVIAKGIYPVTATNSVVLQTVIDQDDFYAANDITAAEGEGNSYITITDYTNSQLSGSFHAYAEFNGSPTLIVGSFNCTKH